MNEENLNQPQTEANEFLSSLPGELIKSKESKSKKEKGILKANEENWPSLTEEFNTKKFKNSEVLMDKASEPLQKPVLNKRDSFVPRTILKGHKDFEVWYNGGLVFGKTSPSVIYLKEDFCTIGGKNFEYSTLQFHVK